MWHSQKACFIFSLTDDRDTPPHISPNLMPAGNDFPLSDRPQAEPSMTLYDWPGSTLIVCQQNSWHSKDQRCASQTHSSPPVSQYSLQLGIPNFLPLFFLSLHIIQTPPFIHSTESWTLTSKCSLKWTLSYNYIFMCMGWVGFNHTATMAFGCKCNQAKARNVAILFRHTLHTVSFSSGISTCKEEK